MPKKHKLVEKQKLGPWDVHIIEVGKDAFWGIAEVPGTASKVKVAKIDWSRISDGDRDRINIGICVRFKYDFTKECTGTYEIRGIVWTAQKLKETIAKIPKDQIRADYVAVLVANGEDILFPEFLCDPNDVSPELLDTITILGIAAELGANVVLVEEKEDA